MPRTLERTSIAADRTEPPPFLCSVISPLLTPCHHGGSIDRDGIEPLVDWLASSGCVRSVFARSGMGQMYSFTVEETKRFAIGVKDAIHGRMGFLLGCCGEWLDRDRGGRPDPHRYISEAVELTDFARSISADAAVHVIPEALPRGRGESVADLIFRYFRTIHDSTDIPIVIYQPRGTPSQYRMTVELLHRLVALPRIAGMKLSSNREDVFRPLAGAARGRTSGFALICGDESYYLQGLRQGACGVIGQGSTGYPEILDSIRARYAAGDESEAADAQSDVDRALKLFEGLDAGVVLKQYLIRNGVGIQPYDRSGAEPYPAGVIDRIAGDLDTIRRTYH